MLEGYRKIHRFRVPFADVDMLGHANNVAYLRWAEHVRTEYFAEVIGGEIGGKNGMILAKMEIVYERPIAYREAVAVGARISRIGTKSFDFAHEVWSEDAGALCAALTSTLVAIDYTTNATIVVPDAWRAIVADYERTV
jgi:acyl-CoA thioester hydrolase